MRVMLSLLTTICPRVARSAQRMSFSSVDFSGPAGPRQKHEFAAFDLERHVVEGDDIPLVDLVHVKHSDHRSFGKHRIRPIKKRLIKNAPSSIFRMRSG